MEFVLLVFFLIVFVTHFCSVFLYLLRISPSFTSRLIQPVVYLLQSGLQ